MNAYLLISSIFLCVFEMKTTLVIIMKLRGGFPEFRYPQDRSDKGMSHLST